MFCFEGYRRYILYDVWVQKTGGNDVARKSRARKSNHKNEIEEFQIVFHIYSLIQKCSNSIANALEPLQSCTEPSIYRCADWNCSSILYL